MLQVGSLNVYYSESHILPVTDVDHRCCIQGKWSVDWTQWSRQKTTLLKAIMGLIKPVAARSPLPVKPITAKSPDQRACRNWLRFPRARESSAWRAENLVLGLARRGHKLGQAGNSRWYFMLFRSPKIDAFPHGWRLEWWTTAATGNRTCPYYGTPSNLLLLDRPEGIQPSIILRRRQLYAASLPPTEFLCHWVGSIAISRGSWSLLRCKRQHCRLWLQLVSRDVIQDFWQCEQLIVMPQQ